MRLFHNIFYRKFKSLPLSYYKRGRELIVAETFTSSVSSSLTLRNVQHSLDNFIEKSNFNFGTSNITEFNSPEIGQTNLVLNDIDHLYFDPEKSSVSFGLKNISHELSPYSNVQESFGLKNTNYELTPKLEFLYWQCRLVRRKL